MLTLTKKTDYALIALTSLAERGGRLTSARELSDTTHVPLPTLTNILKVLAHAGLVQSERGSAGGYRLARLASTITLDEVLTAVEGPFQLVQCSASPADGNGNGACELTGHCPIQGPAQAIQGRLHQFLKQVTVGELLDAQHSQATVGIDIKVPLRRAE